MNTFGVLRVNEWFFLKHCFESIPDYRKVVIIVFLIKGDVDNLHECGVFKNDIVHLQTEFNEISKEQHEKYLDYIPDGRLAPAKFWQEKKYFKICPQLKTRLLFKI